LPSEAEWEYAARAGDTAGRYFGDAPICEFANVRDQSKKKLRSTGQFLECNSGFSNTSPVGSFPPNGFGLYDMLGNVWEWVEDCWGGRSYGDAPGDGAARENALCGERVRRGGSWNSVERYLYNVGTRSRALPCAGWDVFGFRVASDYPAPASAPPEPPTIAQAAPPLTPSLVAPQSSDWDGTWAGLWGGQIASRIIITGGNVVEYDYSRNLQKGFGQTIISGDTLTFSTPRGSVITLTKRGPTAAAAHYRSEADGELVRSSPSAPQSSEWDGTWIGSWGSEITAKIIINGGKVLEYDHGGYPQEDLGQTIISANTLTFGTPPGFVITLTKRGPTAAAAHYHNETDGEFCGNSSRSN